MITIHKHNHTYIQVEADEDYRRELFEYFSVFAEGYKFHPLFKQRRWNGKINFFQISRGLIYVGLLGEIINFCKERRYSLKITDDVKAQFLDENFSKETFAKEVKEIPVTAYGEAIKFRDYQLIGAYDALRTKRKLFSANTSAGKSAIQYLIIRLVQKRIEGKVLLIVPSQNLVEQMYSDFRDYSETDENWDASLECARLYSEYRYDPSKQILISTWQTLSSRIRSAQSQEELDDFFGQFSAVLCDEAHLAKGKEIKTIVELCTNAEYRLAFTGTVPKEKANYLTVMGLFGPIKVLQTSRQAMDAGYVADLDIKCIALKYDKETTKAFKKYKYQEEIEGLCGLEKRNNFISDLAGSLKGNTLILTARVETHGKVLHKLIQERHPDKKVVAIFGEVDINEREDIRKELEQESGIIVIANVQIVGTGWSVRNLHNIIFAFPSKSFTRVVQAIGRGLRKTKDKTKCFLFDIADNFDEKNYSWQHFLERIKIYAEQEFEFSVIERTL